MGAADSPCPGTAEIERLACGEEASAESALHIASCSSCLERLDAARDEAKFVQRVRTLAGSSLAPEGSPRIQGYRTLDVISSGSQGVVFRALQESTSRTVAIKILSVGPAASVRQRARAEREAEIAAKLRHPNIVSVFESRSLPEGRIAVVMEYVDGVPIDAWKPVGASASDRLRTTLEVFVSACNGIHHAHLNGVIHRDVKPDNILVTGEGRPVVLDFGIAKAGGLHATVTGEFAGTPAYASPEQVSGRPDQVDALTDVYSLGVILYRLLCGSMPYEVSGSLLDIARAISEAEPVPPRKINPGLAADLEAIVLRSLAKDKDRRYQSAASLARDIERYLAGDPVEARSGSGWYLLRKAVQLNRRRLALASSAVLLVLLAGTAVAYSLATASRDRERAHAENIRARAVAELLREALPNADPSRPELGRIIGAGLGRLYYRLESGTFASEPEMDQTLRRLWGSVYTDLGSGKASGWVEYAEVSLRNGLVRLRFEHGKDHPEIADTLHELAGVLLVRHRFPEAERNARESLVMRERLAGPGDLKAADTRALLARILLAEDRHQSALHEADLAMKTFALLPAWESEMRIAQMSSLRARALIGLDRVDSVEPLVVDSLTRRLKRLTPEDPELLASMEDAAMLAERRPGSALAGILLESWGCEAVDLPSEIRADIPILAMPDPLTSDFIVTTGRTRAIRRLISLHERLVGRDDPSVVGFLIALMRSAESERLQQIRAGAALRAAEILSRRAGDHDFAVLAFVDYATTVLGYWGDTEEAIASARRSWGIWQSIPERARDRLLAANSRRRLGWTLTLAGRFDEALIEYQAALDEFRREVGGEHYTAALAEAGAAFCLSELGRVEEADRLSAHAFEVIHRPPMPAIDQVGHVRFARGHALFRQHRFAEAREVLEATWEILFRLADPEFRLRRILIQDLIECCETLGDHQGAELWRARMEVGLPRGPAPGN